MKTLLEMYDEWICKGKWSYYTKNLPKLTCYTLSNDNESFKFIEEYYVRAGKVKLFEDEYIDKKPEILKKRAPHIISTYLLGIIIAESFGFDLDTGDSNNINLKYLWFLACLYHDIGYIYEETHCCEYLRDIQSNGLEALKKICNIKNCTISEFKTYTKNEIDVYLSYRAKCLNGEMGVIDHGIAGGLMLYDRLRKNYERAWHNEYNNDKSITRDSFLYNELHFSKEHLKYYAEAADAIISHNIWADTLNKCLEEQGIAHHNAPLIRAKNKIAFILAVADTIEPIKKYGFFVLEKIWYDEKDKGINLLMPEIDDNAYKYLTDLPNWVEITVKEEAKNSFLIQMKE